MQKGSKIDSEIRKLAESHWKYVEGLLKIHKEHPDSIAKVKYHYIETFIHGYKHGVEDCHD